MNFYICTVYAARFMGVSPSHTILSDVRRTKNQRTNDEKFTASERFRGDAQGRGARRVARCRAATPARPPSAAEGMQDVEDERRHGCRQDPWDSEEIADRQQAIASKQFASRAEVDWIVIVVSDLACKGCDVAAGPDPPVTQGLKAYLQFPHDPQAPAIAPLSARPSGAADRDVSPPRRRRGWRECRWRR